MGAAELFPLLSVTKGDSGPCSEGHLPPPDQYFNRTYQREKEMFTFKAQDPIKGREKWPLGAEHFTAPHCW